MNPMDRPPSKTPMRQGPRALLAAIVLVPALGVATAAGLDRGARAPEIGLNDLNGRAVRMSSLRGNVVVIDFWASWCGPCRQEMPVLNGLYRRYRSQGLRVVGVSVDRNVGNARQFLRRTPVSFPIVVDTGHQVANRYAPPRMPSSYIVDRHGVVRYVHEGFRSGDAGVIERQIQALLRGR